MLNVFKKRWDIAVLAVLAALFIFNHRGFFSYVLQLPVLRGISLPALFHTFVITPLLLSAFLLAFYSIGKTAWRSIAGKVYSAYGMVIPSALGLGIFNLIVFIASAAGVLYAPVIAVLVGVFAVFGLRDVIALRHTLTGIKTPSAPWKISLLYIIGMTGFYALIAALSPPTSWDALAYHLPLPKIYVEAHRLFPIHWILQSQSLIGMEMVTASALSLRNDVLAQLLSLFPQILFILVTFRFSKRHFGETVAWISAVIVAVLPVTLRIAPTVNNDFSASLFALIAFVCFVEYVVSPERSWLLMAAAFGGLAVSAKLTGVITLSLIVLLLIALRIKGSIRLERSTLAAGAVIIFALAIAPLVRNYAFTGNPVFPFLESRIVKDSKNMPALERGERETRATLGIERTPLNFILMPVYMIKHPERFQDMPQLFVIPAMLVAALRMFTRKKLSRLEALLTIFIVFYSTLWFISGRHLWRYLLPVIPLMAILAASFWQEIRSPWFKIGAAAALAVNILPLTGWSVNNNLFVVSALPSLSSPGTPARERYLQKTLDHYATYQFANTHLTPEDKVLIFREIRGYYLNVPYMYGDPLYQNIVDYERYADPREFKDQLRSLGITHVLVNRNIYPAKSTYYTPAIMSIMERFLIAYCKALYTANGVSLYEIR